MNAADWLSVLIQATFASSVAILVVLSFRTSLRRGFGSGLAYAAWWLVPMALLAVSLPASTVTQQAIPVLPVAITAMPVAMQGALSFPSGAGMLLFTWIAGVLGLGAWLLLQQLRFDRALGQLRMRDDGIYQASVSVGLPAAIGLLRPRIVVPADFESRYTVQQRALMQLHERIHIRRGDLHANAFVTLLRCVFWFNPLVHIAANRFRQDQELACDQRVVAGHPQLRRAYGEAMFQAQLGSHALPVGCQWGYSHPLRERIQMLKQNPKSKTRRALGTAMVTTLAVAVGATVWAAQPATKPGATDGATSSAAQSNENGASVDIQSKIATPPLYPKAAADGKVTGKVVLVVDVAADGTVSDVVVETSEPAGVFDANTIEAARNWRFNPAMKNGRPVPGKVRVPVWFEMDPPEADAKTPLAGMASKVSASSYERMLTSFGEGIWKPVSPAQQDDC